MSNSDRATPTAAPETPAPAEAPGHRVTHLAPASRKRRRRAAAPSPPPRRRVTPEILVGVAAVLLSCGALVVSVFQVRLLSAQQRAAVWPRLQVGAAHLNDDFTVRLGNAGVGPAIIQEVSFSVRGRSYTSAWALLNGEVGRDTLQTAKFFESADVGDVIRPGESRDLISLPGNPVLADRLDALTADSSYHARLVYSDVYGACWQVDNGTTRSVGRCAEAEG